MTIESQSRESRDELRLDRFYGAMTSLDGIVGALSTEGLGVDELRARDVYTRGLDCHNLGGYPQLERIAAAVAAIDAPRAEDSVLDVGCGLGGPSRFIADRFGCRVTGVDLLPVRIDVARALADMTRTTDRVDFRIADALALPFEDAGHAQVWMMDASIHVRDKPSLFDEIARVLRHDGLLVLHDQMGPLPRAMLPAKRAAPYVAPSLTQLIRVVEKAGFRLELWRDTTREVREYFDQRRHIATVYMSSVSGPDGDRRARQGLALLEGYIETLAGPAGRTGILIARRR
jgi:SAM-dependent methyltransferase